MDPQVKRGEGLSQLTFMMNEGREKQRERKKNSLVSLSYFGIKFQPKETASVPKHRASSHNTDKEPPSASRGDIPQGLMKIPQSKKAPLFRQPDRLQTFSSALWKTNALKTPK